MHIHKALINSTPKSKVKFPACLLLQYTKPEFSGDTLFQMQIYLRFKYYKSAIYILTLKFYNSKKNLKYHHIILTKVPLIFEGVNPLHLNNDTNLTQCPLEVVAASFLCSHFQLIKQWRGLHRTNPRQSSSQSAALLTPPQSPLIPSQTGVSAHLFAPMPVVLQEMQTK